MITNRESKFPYFLVGIGVGFIGGLFFAPRSGEETRKYVRERSTKGLDTLNEQTAKLRQTAERMVQKGREIMSRQCCNSVDTDTEGERQAEQEERRETLGG